MIRKNKPSKFIKFPYAYRKLLLEIHHNENRILFKINVITNK